MALHWFLGRSVVDESVFLPGKELTLEALGVVPVPRSLQMFQVYTSAMRQILKHIGIPDRRSGPSFGIATVAPDHYRSEAVWRLPEPRGWRKSAAFVFADDVSDDISGRVYSSRVGTASLGVDAKVGAGDPAGFVPIGAKGSATIRTSLQFAADPELSAEVLTGRPLVDHMLANLTGGLGYADDPDSADVLARIELQLPNLKDSLIAAYTPPTDWTLDLSHTSFVGDEGDISEATVALTTPSPGRGYVAVQWHDAVSGDGETTDVWAITVDSRLDVMAETDPSETPLPELMMA